jgi:hypothetical protein
MNGLLFLGMMKPIRLIIFSIKLYWISQMNRGSLSPQAKSKAKQLNKAPSAGLIDFLTTHYKNKVPVAAITAASKHFGRNRPLKKEDKAIKRISANSSDVPSSALTQFLST